MSNIANIHKDSFHYHQYSKTNTIFRKLPASSLRWNNLWQYLVTEYIPVWMFVAFYWLQILYYSLYIFWQL
jgi:hypothetical protein